MLSERRTMGMAVNAITWSDLYAFFALKGISPQPWEVDTIRLLDAAYLESRIGDGPVTVTSASALKDRTAKK